MVMDPFGFVGETPGMRFIERLRRVLGFRWRVEGDYATIFGYTETFPIVSSGKFGPITAVVWDVTGEYWPLDRGVEAAVEKLKLRDHEAAVIEYVSAYEQPIDDFTDEECAALRKVRKLVEDATIGEPFKPIPSRGIVGWFLNVDRERAPWSPWPAERLRPITTPHRYGGGGICQACGCSRAAAEHFRWNCSGKTTTR
jgi:hypothetical protein